MNAIKVTPERFSTATGNFGARPSDPHVRRMTRGIQLREDTFATLRLVAGTGENKFLVDAGSRRKDANQQPLTINGKRATDIYSNFLLQQVNEERAEKAQILETFGQPYIFLFGERPRIISFQGVLANTFDFNWEAEWWFNYDQFLRGTRCVENDCRAFLAFDNTIVGGYIIGANASKVATDRNYVNFSFQMFITSYASITDIGNPYAEPVLASGITADDKFDDSETINLTNANAAPFRPNLLPNTISTQIAVSGTQGPLSLAEGLLQQGIQPVVEAWNTIDQITNSVISSISELQGGAVVRVPVGFAGSMAYDININPSQQDPRLVGTYGPVTYTTFGDNYDEFVGVGDQYGSSNPQMNSTLTPDDTQATRLEYGNDMVEKAKELWKQNGYDIPDDELGPLSAFLVGRGIGLVGVGATKGWQTFQTSAGSSDPYPQTNAGGAFVHAAGPVNLG